MIQMPRFAAASTIGVSVASSTRPPVGLQGELMMIAFVLGVMAAMTASGVHRKPFVRARLHDDRLRADELHLLRNRRPVRRVRDDFVAGSYNASAVLKSACLPPAVSSTSAGVMSMP